MKLNVNLESLKKHRKVRNYIAHFEDGMSYYYSYNKETKEFSRYNMTSCSLNSFFIKNKRFPNDGELIIIDEISIAKIKETFKNELGL
jgi:hypothetical protein